LNNLNIFVIMWVVSPNRWVNHQEQDSNHVLLHKLGWER
jgi:hypothetical protein